MSWKKELYLEPIKTPISEQAAITHLICSWKNFYGKQPSSESLSILWSQTILETGRFKYCYRYNVGNEKSKPKDGYFWTMYKCSEILDGREVFFEPPHDQCKFRAFRSAQDGFDHYLKFLAKKSRYKQAMKEIHKGDVVQYTKELKKAGYFTANLNLYLKGMMRLNKEFHDRLDKGGYEWQKEPHTTFTSTELNEIRALVGDTSSQAIDRYFALTDRTPPEDRFILRQKDNFIDSVKKIFSF